MPTATPAPPIEHLRTVAPRARRRFTERSLLASARELAFVAGLFVLYLQVRRLTSGDLDRARANAEHVVGFERWAGAFSERSLQRLVLHSPAAVWVLDHYYVFVHFSVSFTFMAWVFLRHPEVWTRIRVWFLGVTVTGLAIHVAFPLAPPRMLTDQGFVDTLHVYGPSIYSRDVTASAANQLAAMPSLHFAWAALVAAGFIAIRRSRWSLLALLHPVMTLLAIVATANHYWSDATVGLLLVVLAIALTHLAVRAGQPRRAVGLGSPPVLVVDHSPRHPRPRCTQHVPASAAHAIAQPVSPLPTRASSLPRRRAAAG